MQVYDEYDLADRLKERHWQLPPYTLPPDAKCAPLCCHAACAGCAGRRLGRCHFGLCDWSPLQTTELGLCTPAAVASRRQQSWAA